MNQLPKGTFHLASDSTLRALREAFARHYPDAAPIDGQWVQPVEDGVPVKGIRVLEVKRNFSDAEEMFIRGFIAGLRARSTLAAHAPVGTAGRGATHSAAV